MLVDRVTRMKLRIPQSRQDLVALLHREGKIVSQDYEGNDVLVAHDEQSLWSALAAPGQGVMRLVVEVGALERELRDRIGEATNEATHRAAGVGE